MTLGELAELVDGVLEGPADLPVLGVAGLEDARPGTLVRVDAERYLAQAQAGPSAALLVPRNLGGVERPCIRVDRVKLAFIRCLEVFAPDEGWAPGIHPTAVVDPECQLPADVGIGPFAVVGRGAVLGEGVRIGAHCVVGDACELGEGTVLFPNVVLYPRTIVGRRVRIHSGAVLGADGYGYEWDGRSHRKVPQIGRVRIGDDVEIGANSCIDRATTGETVVGPGTKIDNLAQIAHNVRTGAGCLIVSQVGIAGSTVLGNGVVLAGQAGVADHRRLGDGAVVAGGAGVYGDVGAGTRVSGFPARPHREDLRIQAALARLPELMRRVKRLEEELQNRSDAGAEPAED